MYYFSYGSNMSLRRLNARLPAATPVAVASLERHRLMFHKQSTNDGSAKCDACYTGNPEDVVFGVVYTISVPEKIQLDTIEGCGHGYQDKAVSIVTVEGVLMQAATYCASHIDPSLKPYHWYKQHVLRGARENRLPPAYIEMLGLVVSIEDPDPDRHQREMGIYR